MTGSPTIQSLRTGYFSVRFRQTSASKQAEPIVYRFNSFIIIV